MLCRWKTRAQNNIINCFAFHPPNICKILPRRRGSGSDEVDDEGVVIRGKAESRKKKVKSRKQKAESRK